MYHQLSNGAKLELENPKKLQWSICQITTEILSKCLIFQISLWGPSTTCANLNLEPKTFDASSHLQICANEQSRGDTQLLMDERRPKVCRLWPFSVTIGLPLRSVLRTVAELCLQTHVVLASPLIQSIASQQTEAEPGATRAAAYFPSHLWLCHKEESLRVRVNPRALRKGNPNTKLPIKAANLFQEAFCS